MRYFLFKKILETPSVVISGSQKNFWMNTHEYKSWRKRDADQANFIYRQL